MRRSTLLITTLALSLACDADLGAEGDADAGDIGDIGDIGDTGHAHRGVSGDRAHAPSRRFIPPTPPARLATPAVEAPAPTAGAIARAVGERGEALALAIVRAGDGVRASLLATAALAGDLGALVVDDDARAEALALLSASRVAQPGWSGLVHDGEVVLSVATHPAWAGGPARFDQAAAGHFAMTRPLAPGAVPTWLLGVEGQRVALFGAGGQRCTARLGAPRLRSRFEHHDTEEQGPESGPPTRTRRGTVADEALWEQGEILLTAPLTGARGRGCGEALYAVAGAEALEQLVPGAKVSASLTAAALAAFRALPAWQDLQDGYATDVVHGFADGVTSPARWDELWEEAPGVRAWYDAASGRRVVTVMRDTISDQGCGVPGGRLSAGFAIDAATGRLTTLFVDHNGAVPRLLVDLDRDGRLEIIDGASPPSSLSVEEGTLVPLQPRHVPDFSVWGCRC